LADLEELDSAYGYYDKALTIASQIGNHLLIFYASLGDARLKRLKGEAMLAVEGLKQAELSQTKLGTFERALFNLELGLCWLDANKMETAIFALQDAAALFEKGENQTEQAIAGFWLATAMFSQSPDAALPEIKKLIPPQRDWNNPTPLMIQAGRAGRWLKSRNYIRLFRETNLRLFFDQAERTLASIPRLFGKTIHESEHPQPASPQLEVFSFGDARVSYNHRALELSDWKTREARDLFLFMLQSPPRTKEQIALAFWPDISPARLKARFKINMYRIRQALRQDIIIFEDNRYRVNRTVNCCWDREKFDELYQSARQKPPGVEKIRLLEQATELVNGDYFADMEADWVISGRIKYQDLHREATLELAALYLERGQARNCLNTARGLLRSDALLEGAHRLVLQAYAKLGDSANIKLHFSQYQKLLKSEMGLEPSPEIKSLYRQLIAVLRPPL
jgi:two-component SAPR family response regulator